MVISSKQTNAAQTYIRTSNLRFIIVKKKKKLTRAHTKPSEP